MMAGCSTTLPIKQEFPEIPEALLQKCDNLETIDKPTILLSDFIKVITRNYTKYHTCAESVQAWQDWYIKQKDNFNKPKSK